jgi:hypothetical protein
MFAEENLKSGQTKTKPPAPAAEPNGNAPIHQQHACSTASMQINAEASLKHAKDKLLSLFFYLFSKNHVFKYTNFYKAYDRACFSFH